MPAISIKNINKTYIDQDGNEVQALHDINLDVAEGEFVCIVGPSGCGKSTLGRTLIRLQQPTEGHIYLNGTDIAGLKGAQLKEMRKEAQIIFQDPSASLDPRMTVGEIIGEALDIQKLFPNKQDRTDRIKELLGRVGLNTEHANRYPHEFSGGQQQRVGIARALASDPKVVLCDEATSALDPQTTNSILALLKEFNKRLNLTIVMITHQMEVVKEVCDRVAVIENGEIIEEGSMIDVFTDPQKPTTKDFVKSINNVELPALLQSSSISAVYTEGSKLIVRLSFIGNSAGDPIVSGMVKKFDVDINIIYGNIDSLKDIPFGTLVIEISGSAAGIKNALQYLHEQQLKVEVIGYVS